MLALSGWETHMYFFFFCTNSKAPFSNRRLSWQSQLWALTGRAQRGFSFYLISSVDQVLRSRRAALRPRLPGREAPLFSSTLRMRLVQMRYYQSKMCFTKDSYEKTKHCNVRISMTNICSCPEFSPYHCDLIRFSGAHNGNSFHQLYRWW